MTIFETPQAQCPICGHRMNRAGVLDEEGEERAPAADDPTVCIYCGEFLAYTDTLTVRILTNKEWLALSLDQRRDMRSFQMWVRTNPVPEEPSQ